MTTTAQRIILWLARLWARRPVPREFWRQRRWPAGGLGIRRGTSYDREAGRPVPASLRCAAPLPAADRSGQAALPCSVCARCRARRTGTSPRRRSPTPANT